MNKEQWKEIAHEIVPHLEAIRQVVERSEIDTLSMASFAGGRIRAFYIDDLDNITYDIEVDERDINVYMIHHGEYTRETIKERPNRPASLGRSEN